MGGRSGGSCRVDVVCTTVGDGGFLGAYAEAALEADADVRLIVIPDLATPRGLYDAVHKVRDHVQVLCPDPGGQQVIVRQWRAEQFFGNWNTDHRRNLGYLLALRDEPDVLISVDDDNLPEAGFVAEHAVVAAPAGRHTVVSCPGGWFNPGLLLDTGPLVWPRGFPYAQRHRSPWTSYERAGTVAVAVNAGLWLGDPDVDAITRLTLAPEADEPVNGPLVLDAGTWAPVNSQNTAVRGEAIPAYYFTRMGALVRGLRCGRFGDIFQGYFVQACAKALGQTVRFGPPLVRHERNAHDLFADLRAELPSIELAEQVAAWLPEVKLSGSTYPQVYEDLAGQLDDTCAGTSGDAAAALRAMAGDMREWLRLCERVRGG